MSIRVPNSFPRPIRPSGKEKAIAGLCYPTFGIVGLLYILLAKQGGTASPLFRFHFIQSILIWVIAMLVGWGWAPLTGILANILGLFGEGVKSIFANGVDMINSLFGIAYTLLLVYGTIWAFLGKFAEVPVISRIVRQNVPR